MKKILALILCLLMLLTASASLADGLMGGWSHAADPAVTDEREILFREALKDLVGVDYTPVAYLGSQVVAGKNHCFLAQGTAVYPDAQPSWYLIFITQGLDGNVSVLSISPFDFGELCVF